MMAALVALVLAFGLAGLTGCGEKEEAEDPVYTAFAGALDLDFAKEVNETIAAFGDDEAVGMRSA